MARYNPSVFQDVNPAEMKKVHKAIAHNKTVKELTFVKLILFLLIPMLILIFVFGSTKSIPVITDNVESTIEVKSTNVKCVVDYPDYDGSVICFEIGKISKRKLDAFTNLTPCPVYKNKVHGSK